MIVSNHLPWLPVSDTDDRINILSDLSQFVAYLVTSRPCFLTRRGNINPLEPTVVIWVQL